AVSGTPFGQRFQTIWAPIRLVMALGLLIPISNYGLNSAQYLVLYAAKYGSGFATHTWNAFNATMTGSPVFASGGVNPSGERTTLIARPVDPDISPVVQFMSIAHACQYAYWKFDNNDPASGPGVPPNFYIKSYFVKNPLSFGDQAQQLEVTPATSYQEAL